MLIEVPDITLYSGNNTAYVELSGLSKVDYTGSTVVNDATVTVDIIAPNGLSVIGPVASMFYLAGSEGVYVYSMPAATSIIEGKVYTIKIKAVDTAGASVEWEPKVLATKNTYNT